MKFSEILSIRLQFAKIVTNCYESVLNFHFGHTLF